jgi:hypothetical protein
MTCRPSDRFFPRGGAFRDTVSEAHAERLPNGYARIDLSCGLVVLVDPTTGSRVSGQGKIDAELVEEIRRRWGNSPRGPSPMRSPHSPLTPAEYLPVDESARLVQVILTAVLHPPAAHDSPRHHGGTDQCTGEGTG